MKKFKNLTIVTALFTSIQTFTLTSVAACGRKTSVLTKCTCHICNGEQWVNDFNACKFYININVFYWFSAHDADADDVLNWVHTRLYNRLAWQTSVYRLVKIYYINTVLISELSKVITSVIAFVQRWEAHVLANATSFVECEFDYYNDF